MTQILMIYFRQALPTSSAKNKICQNSCHCLSLVRSGFTAEIVQGTRNDKNFNDILCVFRCLCRGGGRHCRQAAQFTNYIQICVIACPLYSQGSQRQLCKGQAMTQILMICFVSCVAPEGAEAGTADKQHKAQIILNLCHCVPLVQGHAMIQILMIYFVSCVAPEGARQALPTSSARNNLYQHVCHWVSLYNGHAITQLSHILCVFRCP
jgi:hypothetical protein